MTLYIDAANFNKVTFAIADNKKTISKSYKIDPHKSHLVLAKFSEFLKGKKFKLRNIKRIVVNKGPGSYTGVRIGAAHAQALGFALNLPVRFLAKEVFDETI